MTKYCIQSSFGIVDNKTVLEHEDDVVYVKSGGKMRMPTVEEMRELIDNCYSTRTTDYNGTGITGWIITSNKPGYTDKSIFLPAAGYFNGKGLNYAANDCYYWTATVETDYQDYGKCSIFERWGKVSQRARYFGMVVRPVSD